jgi:TonB family protein
MIAPLLALALTASAPQSGVPVPPTPANNPGDWIHTADYPAAALRAEASGATAFRVTVAPEGVVSECAITQSSGNPALDEATCRLVRQRAVFNPARDPQGKPTIGTYSNRVRWTIPEFRQPPQPGLVTRSYDIERNGTISHCRIEIVAGSFIQEVSTGDIPCADVQFETPVDAAGKPVRKHVVETFEIRTAGDGSANKP